MTEVVPPELKGLVAEKPEEDGGGPSNEDVPQMFPDPDEVTSRPQREEGSVVTRRVRSQQKVEPVDTKALPLPRMQGR